MHWKGRLHEDGMDRHFDLVDVALLETMVIALRRMSLAQGQPSEECIRVYFILTN